MSKTKLHIRLAKWLDGDTIDERTGVVTNIYATGKGASSKGLRDVLIPVTEDENVYRTVELEPGSYLIESVLPSGEIVTEEILLKEDEPQRVALRGEPSPHEWLSWQQFSGNVGRQSFAPDEPWALSFAPGAGDPLSKGLAEIGPGSFREESFSGAAQWDTLVRLIGRESDERMEALKQWTQAAHDEASESEGLSWTPCDEYDEVTQVFHLEPGSGAGKGEIRDFLYWTGGGAELIRVPQAWVSLNDFEEKAINVMTDRSGEGKRFRSSVTVKDPFFGTALGYLTAGSLPQARLLLDQAEDMLYEKVANPYAAAAGAYLLLSAGKPGPDDRWPQWIENLRNWFRWLPDGAVLNARLKLLYGSSPAAIDELKQAYRRGVPLYSVGVKRLLEGLSLVAAEDDECQEMERTVRRIAWRTNMDQYFTVIRLGPA